MTFSLARAVEVFPVSVVARPYVTLRGCAAIVTVPAACRTITVPRCLGCTVGSSYLKRPTFVKVNENDCVGASTGDVNGASLETTRRLRESVFVQVTVSPTATVVEFGLNPVAVIATRWVAAVDPGTTATPAASVMS